MRGRQNTQGSFVYSFSAENRIPKNHPLRAIKDLADSALARLDLDSAYSTTGRPSVPPEVLLKARLLMSLFSIRSVRSCLLYTSPSPRDATLSRMPSSA